MSGGARLLALVLGALGSGCGGCGEVALPAAGDAGPERAPLEPWTFGAARTREALVLPPPCVERAPTLKTVLGRNTRIASEPHTLGRLWAAEGPSGGNVWRAEASGIVELTHGRTTPSFAPWPEAGPPLVARTDAGWQLVYDEGDALFTWRDGSAQALSLSGPAVAFDCAGSRCALLAGGELRIGDRADDVSRWRRLSLREHGEEGLAVRVTEDAIAIVLYDRLRVRFYRVIGDGPMEPTATLGATPRLLASLAAPRPAVMIDPPFQLVDGCANDGGVMVAVDGRAPLRLRSTEPPLSGELSALAHGMLATWIAPLRCRSRRRMLYAAMLDGEAAAGPVTTVGETDALHVATEGDDVDLWLHSQTENTITWVRARCR